MCVGRLCSDEKQICYDFSIKDCGGRKQIFEDSTFYSLANEFEINLFKKLKCFY